MKESTIRFLRFSHFFKNIFRITNITPYSQTSEKLYCIGKSSYLRYTIFRYLRTCSWLHTCICSQNVANVDPLSEPYLSCFVILFILKWRARSCPKQILPKERMSTNKCAVLFWIGTFTLHLLPNGYAWITY